MRTLAFFCGRALALAILVFGGGPLYAQIKVLRVEPGQTDPAIATVHGPNLALYDPQVTSRHRLFLFIVGTGGQARTQLEAIATVKQLEIVHAYGRDPKRRETFCEVMSKRIGVPVHAASTASEAVKAAHIVCTATTAMNPVIRGADLETGSKVKRLFGSYVPRQEQFD